MDNIEEQMRLLKEQGLWVSQECSNWMSRAISEFYRYGKVSEKLIKESKELLGRSEQWCKDVENRGLAGEK